MGRVYVIEPDKSKGERSGMGCRVYTHTGSKIRYTQRIEFDRDTDRGLATVTALLPTGEGGENIVLSLPENVPVAVTFRAWVQVVRGEDRPTVTTLDDLTVNPDSSPDAEPYILWSELEDAAAAIKANFPPGDTS